MFLPLREAPTRIENNFEGHELETAKIKLH